MFHIQDIFDSLYLIGPMPSACKETYFTWHRISGHVSHSLCDRPHALLLQNHILHGIKLWDMFHILYVKGPAYKSRFFYAGRLQK